MEDTSVRLGLLLDAIEVQRGAAEQAVRQLEAHGQGLDAVVRAEIAHTLSDELAGLHAEVTQAQVALRQLAGRVNLRLVSAILLMGTLAGAAPLMLARMLVPSADEVRLLRAQEAALSAHLVQLREQGAALQLRRCGSAQRLCVRIERDAGTYGASADFLVAKGY